MPSGTGLTLDAEVEVAGDGEEAVFVLITNDGLCVGRLLVASVQNDGVAVTLIQRTKTVILDNADELFCGRRAECGRAFVSSRLPSRGTCVIRIRYFLPVKN
jgi:hypothetical protein